MLERRYLNAVYIKRLLFLKFPVIFLKKRKEVMSLKQINKKIKKVPPHLLPEVMDYIDYLINKYGPIPRSEGVFNFMWEGGLSEISQKYTSVDLQHKAMDWR